MADKNQPRSHENQFSQPAQTFFFVLLFSMLKCKLCSFETPLNNMKTTYNIERRIRIHLREQHSSSIPTKPAEIGSFFKKNIIYSKGAGIPSFIIRAIGSF